MPVATDRFSLERHTGPYESWPLRTRLFAGVAPTAIELPAYALLHQFETPAGFLLAADCECPYEEATTFALVSRDLRLLAWRTLGAPYASFLLDGIDWPDEHCFIASFHGGLRYQGTIHTFLRPRLKLRRLA